VPVGAQGDNDIGMATGFDARFRSMGSGRPEAATYHQRVDAAEVRSATEVERLTPDERQQLLNDRTSTDLSQIAEDFVAKARPKVGDC
jgi:hypothetical protein